MLRSTSRLTRAVCETLESRRLLSAGDLDATFGTGGHVTADVAFWSSSDALVPLSDGSGDMLIVGQGVIKKIDSSGTIDTSFGVNGSLAAVEDTTWNEVHDVEIVAGGKILVTTRQQISRYNANGSIDATFANGGSRSLMGVDLISVYDIAVQADGKIIIQGDYDPPARITRLVRLTADGSADNTFTPFDYTTSSGTSGSYDPIRVQADGKILLGGTSLAKDGRNASIVRLNSNGTIDETFGDGGFYGNHSGDTRVQDFVVDSQGRIVTLALASSGVLKIGRLSASGVIDATFGGAAAGSDHQTDVAFGMIENGPISTSNQYPRLRIAPDGKIVAHDAYHLTRLNADGTLDASFGRVVSLFLGRNLYGIAMKGVVPVAGGGMFVAGQDGANPAELGNVYRLQVDGMSAGSISLASGTLSIDGTSGDDSITVMAPPTSILDTPQIVVTQRGSFGRVFDTADVTLVSVDAAEGDDAIWLQSTAMKPATVSGGDGDDSIVGSAADDSLSGNAGRDNIEGLGGNDRLSGNGARDKLSGGDGDDRLYGGSSGDFLAGQAGVDQLFGEGGNDRLSGGDGADDLHGNAGDDSFFTNGDNAIDHIFGDGGTDFASHDADDIFIGLETETEAE